MSQFTWNPGTFAVAVQQVTGAQGMLLNTIKTMIRALGSMSCPPPSWDPHGFYRVALGQAGTPEIQTLQGDGETWARANIMPPTGFGAPGRARDQKFGILDAQTLLATDLAGSLGVLGAGVLYLDIDHFKQVNSKYTERVVDRTILPQFQRLVADAALAHGHAYAEGGDEVVVLLPNFSSSMATAFAADLLGLVRSAKFVVESTEVHLTISAGLAVTRVADEVATLPDRANVAKKHAKEQGRDRVSVWAPGGCNPCLAPTVSPAEQSDNDKAKRETAQPTYGTLDELWEERENAKRRGPSRI
jgi:diguanylate cyclase (GGDEF)-like protein